MSSSALSATTQLQVQRMVEDRRELLTGLLQESAAIEVAGLLKEIDAALDRIEHGRYGLRCVCDESFTEAELHENPLASYGLCHLSSERQRALENDLELAWQVQAAVLPEPRQVVRPSVSKPIPTATEILCSAAVEKMFSGASMKDISNSRNGETL